MKVCYFRWIEHESSLFFPAVLLKGIQSPQKL